MILIFIQYSKLIFLSKNTVFWHMPYCKALGSAEDIIVQVDTIVAPINFYTLFAPVVSEYSGLLDWKYSKWLGTVHNCRSHDRKIRFWDSSRAYLHLVVLCFLSEGLEEISISGSQFLEDNDWMIEIINWCPGGELKKYNKIVPNARLDKKPWDGDMIYFCLPRHSRHWAIRPESHQHL